jgi:hypothetical protein
MGFCTIQISPPLEGWHAQRDGVVSYIKFIHLSIFFKRKTNLRRLRAAPPLKRRQGISTESPLFKGGGGVSRRGFVLM